MHSVQPNPIRGAMKMKKAAKILITVSALIFILFVITPAIIEPPDSQKIKVALEWGRLAPIPNNSEKIIVETIGGMFSRTFYIYFKSSDLEINKWIEKSSSIEKIKVEKFSKESMLLPDKEYFLLIGEYIGDCNPNTKKIDKPTKKFQHQCIFLNEKFPWFYPVIKERGRRYEIPQDANACGGEIIINDVTGEVFIRISHS